MGYYQQLILCEAKITKGPKKWEMGWDMSLPQLIFRDRTADRHLGFLSNELKSRKTSPDGKK